MTCFYDIVLFQWYKSTFWFLILNKRDLIQGFSFCHWIKKINSYTSLYATSSYYSLFVLLDMAITFSLDYAAAYLKPLTVI